MTARELRHNLKVLLNSRTRLAVAYPAARYQAQLARAVLLPDRKASKSLSGQTSVPWSSVPEASLLAQPSGRLSDFPKSSEQLVYPARSSPLRASGPKSHPGDSATEVWGVLTACETLELLLGVPKTHRGPDSASEPCFREYRLQRCEARDIGLSREWRGRGPGAPPVKAGRRRNVR